MAKDSPYFKFHVSEYNDGDIQLCSLEAQGLFINVCSLYWSRECNLLLSKAKKLFKVRDKVWQELIDENVIKVEDDLVSVSFLDEQLIERDKLSKQNSKNVAKRHQKQRKEPTSVDFRSTNIDEPVYNIENRREEKIREEKSESKTRDIVWFQNQINERFYETLKFNHKGKDISKAIQDSYAHMLSDPERLARADPSDVRKLVNTWLVNQKPNQENGILKILTDTNKRNAIIEAKFAAKATG